MTLSLVDRNGIATIAAAEGEAALASGDTPRARQKFAEAGAILEKSIADVRRQLEKHMARFLAATQYYKGGDYQKALELCQKIEQRLLPEEVRPLFPKFFRDVRSRASEGYESRVRRELKELWSRKDHQGILKLLQEHPYVIPPGGMAFFRAIISEKMQNYRTAALFYANAVRLKPDDPGLVFTAMALPLALPQEDRLEEAWEYVEHQVELLPHPVTYLVASILCFHRASAADEQDRKRLIEEQLRYFDLARAGYGALPYPQQANTETRNLLILGYEAAALGLLRLGDGQRARTICDDGIHLEPNASQLWAVRGLVRYPEAEAIQDSQRAVALGDDSYFPYYNLAYAALKSNDFLSALSWSQQALQKSLKPGPKIASQLYGWIAVCRAQLDGDRQEIEGLFRKAREIDPVNEEVENNYRLYIDWLNSAPPHAPPAWNRGRPRGMEDLFLSDRKPNFPDKFSSTNRVQRELQAAGI